MKSVLVIFFMLFNFHTSYSQNLVPNPSFEQVNVSKLPCRPTYLSRSEFNQAMMNWVQPTDGTSDIFTLLIPSPCWTYPYDSLYEILNSYYPKKRIGWQTPRTGRTMAGIITYDFIGYGFRDYREYVQTKLKSTMKVGKEYQISFYVSIAENSDFANNNIGAYLSVQPISSIFDFNLACTPQLEAKEIINDSINWVKIDTVITATENWEYITIGNFRSDKNTNAVRYNTKGIGRDQQKAYYFIDDVDVRSTCSKVSDDKIVCSGLPVNLTASGSGFIGWAEYDHPEVLISTDSIFTINPTISTAYLAYHICDTNSVNISVAEDYHFNLDQNLTLCKGDSIIPMVTVTNNFIDYNWPDGSTRKFLKVTSPGQYILKTKVNDCYSQTDTFNIQLLNLPKVDLGPDIKLCEGQPATVGASFPKASYLWSPNKTTKSWEIINFGGLYKLTVTDSNNCKGSDEIRVFYDVKPLFKFGSDMVLCPNQKLSLNAMPSNKYLLRPNIRYNWQDGSTANNFLVSTSGVFIASVTSGVCVTSDTINITYAPTQIIDLGNDTILCNDQQLVLNQKYPGTTYVWQDNSTTSSFTVSKEGLYFVRANFNNCIYKDSVQVRYIETPKISLGKDRGIQEGQSLYLDATFPNATYTWQDGSTGSTFQVNQEGKYWVSVANQNYCFDSDTVYIYEIRMKMPNVFSPNGDGKNDSFVPIDMNGFLSASIYVTNRWGETIFESSNFSNHQGWDGKHAGSDVPEGIYFWMVKLQDVNGKDREVKGTLSLVR